MEVLDPVNSTSIVSKGKLSSESYSAYFCEIWNTIMDSIEE
jgi:hypothetical protein